MDLKGLEGKHTVETLAEKRKITKQAAVNLISKLKKEGYAQTSGGGRQKRIYTIKILPIRPTNGLYDVLNKYSSEKLAPAFKHYVHGRYSVENAVIDALEINDIRTLEAAKSLFLHVKDWKKLFDMAKKKNITAKLMQLYQQAKSTRKVRKIPKRYA
jgi:hypothetical protein